MGSSPNTGQTDGANTPSVCLNMIVRNEADYIRRAIESARGLFDKAAIVDTGSTDGTQDIIRELIPGVLLEEHEWVDFAHNRNRALRVAEQSGCEYILLMDADETFEDKPASWGPLGADVYYLHYDGPYDYAQPRLIKNGHPWLFRDRRHGYLDCETDRENLSPGNLRKPLIIHHGWDRHAEEKMVSDIVGLQEMLEEDPSPRTLFNLAKALEGIGRFDEALALYRARSREMGDEEERFFSLYRAGVWTVGRQSFLRGARMLLDAWEMRPGRIEPLRFLAEAATGISDRAPYPEDDLLFVERAAYTPQEKVPRPAGASL